MQQFRAECRTKQKSMFLDWYICIVKKRAPLLRATLSMLCNVEFLNFIFNNISFTENVRTYFHQVHTDGLWSENTSPEAKNRCPESGTHPNTAFSVPSRMPTTFVQPIRVGWSGHFKSVLRPVLLWHVTFISSILTFSKPLDIYKPQHQKPSLGTCAPRWRFWSDCAFAQSDQNLHWAHFGQPRKIVSSCGQWRLIRLCGCACWFESSLGVHVRRYVFSCWGSHNIKCWNKITYILDEQKRWYISVTILMLKMRKWS